MERNVNYETYNNKKVASIYIKVNDDFIELIQDCFDKAIIISKFRSQFADKIWGAESTAYHNLHQINLIDFIDMPDCVSKLCFTHYHLANMVLVISSKRFMYVLIMELGPNFESWSTIVQNFSRASSEPPAFGTLTSQLLIKDIYQSTAEATSVALLVWARITKNPPKCK